jgi:hypothetical protein
MPQNLGARGSDRHLGLRDFHHGLLALATVQFEEDAVCCAKQLIVAAHAK